MKKNLDMSKVKALSPGTAIHKKGKLRVQNILEVASNVLAFEGYSNFKMRNIAGKAGITLRNLQYYFQTKENLFQAVVDKMLEEDAVNASKVIEKKGLTPEERFLEFMRYSIKVNQSPRLRGFQFELWALATRDPFAAMCRDRMTSVYCEFIYQLIKPLTSHLSSSKQRKKAAMLLAMLQGFPLVAGDDVSIQFALGNLKNQLEKEALRFIISDMN